MSVHYILRSSKFLIPTLITNEQHLGTCGNSIIIDKNTPNDIPFQIKNVRRRSKEYS